MRRGVAGKRVDQHRGDALIGETALEGELHHPSPVALAQAIGLPDPDVDRSEVLGDELLAPVRLLVKRRFPLPVVVQPEASK